jgi:hypothetical protein
MATVKEEQASGKSGSRKRNKNGPVANAEAIKESQVLLTAPLSREKRRQFAQHDTVEIRQCRDGCIA